MWYYCIKMEFQKITNFLDINFDNEDLPKYVTKKWIEIYDQSQGSYDECFGEGWYSNAHYGLVSVSFDSPQLGIQ